MEYHHWEGVYLTTRPHRHPGSVARVEAPKDLCKGIIENKNEVAFFQIIYTASRST